MAQSPVEDATPLDPDEAEGLIPSHIGTREELNEWEQANIAAAAVWLEEKRPEPVLTMRFLEELHRRMFDKTWKWAGVFRWTGKNIGVPVSSIREDLNNLLKDTDHWIEHKTYSTDEIAARFHHRLVSIHPFPNGNGRHARLMTQALQDQRGVPRFTWGWGSLLKDGETRTAYITALQAADRGVYEQLITFVRS